MALPGTTLRAGVHHKTTLGGPDGCIRVAASTNTVLTTPISTDRIDAQRTIFGTPNKHNRITAWRPSWGRIIAPFIGQTDRGARLDISYIELRGARAVRHKSHTFPIWSKAGRRIDPPIVCQALHLLTFCIIHENLAVAINGMV